MAEFEAIGKALQIPQSVLNNIEKIDQKINLIASDSEKMATHFMSAMTRMGTGADDLLKKLQSIQCVINGLGSVNIGGLGSVSKGIGSTATQAEKAAASISEAASALNRFVQTWKGSGRVTSMLDSLATREQVNLLRELNNQAMQTSRTLTQMNRENSLEARKKANETKIASQEETNATNRKMEALKRENAQTKINTAEYRNYVSALTMSESSENSRIKKIERMSTVLSELQRKESLYANEIEVVRKKIEQLTRENESLTRVRDKANKQRTDERTNTQALNAYNRAMASSEALVTQRINKIAKLRQAEEMLRNASGNYATQLNRISQEIARLNRLNEGQVDSYGRVIRSQRNLINTSQQLTRQLALLFSVSQIESYISKLIQVRGEFELQQTALASILQNKDEADQLFGQITELAVRSPFTIKELTTYSKSLAAYQVQYEDLYGTLKMLADVSSGLGVDMQRLILAFGQVKAANFLRGTETRQFTEAGINMLGELAKYYSELEGRIVSVTEVQDRQFKRMISFQDVEEVFKRLTSAGGMFYNMQEKQAETLRGQMMNLQDQIDLMLNDIGKSNQSTISTIISLVKSVIENWKTIAQVMEPIATILVGYLSVTKLWSASVANLPKIWKSIQTNVLLAVGSITKAEAAQRGFNNATRLNAWLAIGAVVATVIWEVVNALKAANEDQEKLNKVVSEGYDSAVTMSANYRRLANIVSDTTASYEEQESALSELKRTYGEILPQHYLEANAIRAMKGNYDEATSAIYNYIQAKTQEKQLQVIAENEGEDLSDTQQDLAKEMQLLAKSTSNYNMSLNEANSIINKIGEDIKKGLVKSSDDAVKRFKELYKISTGVELPSGLAPSELRDYYDNFVELEKRKDEILSQTNTAFADSITRDLQEQLKVVDGTIKQMRSLLNTISHAGEVGEDGAIITQKQVDDAKEKLIQITSSWGVESSKIQNLTGSAFEIKQATIDFTVSAYQSLLNRLSNAKFEPDQQASVNKFMEDLQKRIDSFDATPFENYMSDIIQAAATANSISLDGVMDVFARTNETVDEYRKRLKGIIDQLQSDLANYAKSPYLVAMWTGNPQAAAEAQKKLLVAQTAYSAVNVGETSGGKGNSENNRLKEQIRLIQEAGKEYEKYRNLYDEPMAQQLTEEAFTQAFKDVGLSVDMEFDVNGVIEGIRKVTSTAGAEGQKIGNEAIAKLQTDANTEERTKEVEGYRKQIDELFASLSNYQELEKLGLNKGLISKLFGINVSSIQDVQDVFNKIKVELKKYGKEGEKLIADSEKKITDAQQKELNDRLKKYAEYLSKSLNQIENVQREAGIDIQYAGMLFGQGKLDSEQYSQVIKNVISEMNSEISKINVEKFKESSEYIKAMGDLSLYSKNELRQLAEQIQRLISDSAGKIDASDLKVYQDALDNINDNIREIDSPFKNNPISEFKELVRIQEEFNEEKKRFNELLKKRNELEIQLEQAKIELERLRKMQEEEPNKDFSSNISNTQNNIKDIVGQIGSMNNQLNFSQGMMSNLSSQAGGMMDNQQITMAKIDKIIKSVYNTINSIVEQFEELKELAETFGAETDKGIWNKLSISFNAISEMNENVMSSWESYKSGDYVGASVKAVSAVFSVIKGINALHDNKREEKIQKELDLIEDLQHAYEKLEKAIDDAYSLDQYQRAYDMSKENLEQQREALQESIRLEEDKKKTDKDRIKEWEQQIDDIEEQLEELAEEQFSTATSGILDSVLSAADEFTNAWLESFREVGDGMDGLNENFQSILEDMLKRQASMLITGAYIDRWKKELEKYINEDDLELTAGEAKNWVDAVTSSLPGLNKALEEYFKAMQQAGFDLTGEGEGDTLTGLQRGIESITHEQSDALQALLESLRFFVSDENAVIHNIYNTLTMPTEENPFLAELRVQSEQLRLLYGLWNGVIKNVSGSGRAVNVRIV